MTEILLLGAGFVVGVMNAIAGGGILLGFPVLLSTGISPLAANATANIAVLPGLLSSAFGYRNYIKKVPNIYLLLLIPCFMGAIVGALLLVNTSNAHFEDLVPWLVAFAVGLFVVQPYLHVHVHKTIKKKRVPLQPFIGLSLALLPLAIYGGYFGAGFGFVMLAFLGFTTLHDIHQMNGLKNLASATIALTTICILIPSDLIDWRAGATMATGSLLGGYFGSKIALKVPSKLLRLIVISIGVITVGYLFIDSLAK